MEGTPTQLALLEEGADWRLDERTREVGRQGVASARDALRDARRAADERDRARKAA